MWHANEFRHNWLAESDVLKKKTPTTIIQLRAPAHSELRINHGGRKQSAVYTASEPTHRLYARPTPVIMEGGAMGRGRRSLTLQPPNIL